MCQHDNNVTTNDDRSTCPALIIAISDCNFSGVRTIDKKIDENFEDYSML